MDILVFELDYLLTGEGGLTYNAEKVAVVCGVHHHGVLLLVVALLLGDHGTHLLDFGAEFL